MGGKAFCKRERVCAGTRLTSVFDAPIITDGERFIKALRFVITFKRAGSARGEVCFSKRERSLAGTRLTFVTCCIDRVAERADSGHRPVDTFLALNIRAAFMRFMRVCPVGDTICDVLVCRGEH